MHLTSFEVMNGFIALRLSLSITQSTSLSWVYMNGSRKSALLLLLNGIETDIGVGVGVGDTGCRVAGMGAIV